MCGVLCFVLLLVTVSPKPFNYETGTIFVIVRVSHSSNLSFLSVSGDVQICGITCLRKRLESVCYYLFIFGDIRESAAINDNTTKLCVELA